MREQYKIIETIRKMEQSHGHLFKDYKEREDEVTATHHRIAQLTLLALLDELFKMDEDLIDDWEVVKRGMV